MKPYLDERLVVGGDPVGRREPRLPDRMDRRPARRGQAVRRDQQRQPGPVGRRVRRRRARRCSWARRWRSPRTTWTSSTTEPTATGPGGRRVRRAPGHSTPTTESEDDDSRPALPGGPAPARGTAAPDPAPPACSSPASPSASAPSGPSATRTSPIRAGRVHALVGENGAGKSTMIKIISGVEAADTGHDRVRGPAGRHPSTTGDAMALGIATVYQEPQLFAELTVSENIFTGREIRKGGRIDWAEQNAKVVELLELLGLPARYATVPVGDAVDRRAAAGLDRQGAGRRRDGADPRRAVGDPDRRRDRGAVRRRPPADRVRGVGHLHLPPARRAVPDRRRGHGDARRADHRHVPDRASCRCARSPS